MTKNGRVRPARPQDAEQVVRVLHSSITELCSADHHDDPKLLGRWLSNKTREHFLRWLEDDETCLVVFELEGLVKGVALLRQLGEVQLCYVEPGFQRRGIGTSLLAALETQASAWQLQVLRLNSSAGAREFYERAGFRATGDACAGLGGLTCYPYAKSVPGSGDTKA